MPESFVNTVYMETVLISPPFEIKKRADYEKVHLLYAFRSLQGKEHDLFEISLNLQIFSLEKGFYFIYGVFFVFHNFLRCQNECSPQKWKNTRQCSP